MLLKPIHQISIWSFLVIDNSTQPGLMHTDVTSYFRLVSTNQLYIFFQLATK